MRATVWAASACLFLTLPLRRHYQEIGSDSPPRAAGHREGQTETLAIVEAPCRA